MLTQEAKIFNVTQIVLP